MPGHVFIAPGDITQLCADAIGYSASSKLTRDGNLCSSFETNVPGFAAWYKALGRSQSLPAPVGSTYWMPLDPNHKPHGLVLTVSTGRTTAETDKAGLAVRSALKRAVTELRRIKPTGRLLIGLPAF